MINLMIRKPNSVSEVSSWMLFIVTQASSMPIARTFSKARLKIMKPFDGKWTQLQHNMHVQTNQPSCDGGNVIHDGGYKANIPDTIMSEF